MPEADVIVLKESNTVSKIYPPVSYRPLILEELHKSGRQSAAVYERARIHYIWPSIRKDINDHVQSCTRCLEIKPSKSQARASGLTISLRNLQPMDWISTDLAEKVLSNGKKIHFLLIVDRASGFVKVYKLRGTKTKHVIECLQDFNEIYCGPPYWLTSDGGPQFSAANEAIQKWAMEAKISHQVSSAYNPEGNGEAERNVGRVKHAIAHAGDKLESLNSIVANLNTDQRTDGSGSAAELFLQRTLRVPGLAHIPSHVVNTDKEKEARVKSREKQVELTKSQRKPDVFNVGQRVMVQNNTSKLWNIKGTIVSRREHQGHLSNSYVIKVSRTGRQICRSERHIRAVHTDKDTNGINISKDDIANSVLVSSTGNRLRSSLKSSSGPRVSGGENSTGGRPAPALNLRAASGTGSEAEANLAPTPASQPTGSLERVKTLRFSEILHVFEPSGEDYFDKEVLKDFRKSSQTAFSHEDYTKDREAVQKALSKWVDEREDVKDNEGGGQVYRDGRCTLPRGRGDQRPGEPRQKPLPLQHAGQ